MPGPDAVPGPLPVRAPEARPSLGGVTVDGQLSEGVHVMQHHAASAWLMAAAEEPGVGTCSGSC
ncbi:hypothetical protein SGLAM104S_04689 [Streptomyces glaucescens]